VAGFFGDGSVDLPGGREAMSSFLSTWLIGLAAASILMFGAWTLSLWRRDAGIIDGFWGSGFVLLAWIYWVLAGGTTERKLLLVILVTLWGLRLTGHIALRNWGEPEDYRYREMREKHGATFPVVSLFKVFLLQGGLMWLISVPLLQAQSARAPLNLLDVAGVIVFAVGLVFETIGDLQLVRFRADPDNRGRVLRTGLWRFTRHPNYFGDAAVWWGFFLIALATPGSAWTVFSPLLMTFFLLKVSGVVMLEKKLVESRPEYAEYVASTSAFVPWFPRKPRTAGSTE
jgi:steroid 5-alpha reductase family enzyme